MRRNIFSTNTPITAHSSLLPRFNIRLILIVYLTLIRTKFFLMPFKKLDMTIETTNHNSIIPFVGQQKVYHYEPPRRIELRSTVYKTAALPLS